jgi:hypothetical protein
MLQNGACPDFQSILHNLVQTAVCLIYFAVFDPKQKKKTPIQLHFFFTLVFHLETSSIRLSENGSPPPLPPNTLTSYSTLIRTRIN